MILLTGATGNTGGQVAAQLHQKKVPFSVMARGQESARRLRGLGYRVVEGDFDRPTSMRAAMSGVTKLYLVCTPDERMLTRECNAIEAAQEAGVAHVVKLSAFCAGVNAPTINLRVHGEIEELASKIASGEEKQTKLPEDAGEFSALLHTVAVVPTSVGQGLHVMEWVADNIPFTRSQFVGSLLMVAMRRRNQQGALALALQKSPKVRKMLAEYQAQLGLGGGAGSK